MRAKRATFTYILSGQKFIKNAKNGSWKPKACGQTVLLDRWILIGQKLMENAKIRKSKWDILSHFQTMCDVSSHKTWKLDWKITSRRGIKVQNAIKLSSHSSSICYFCIL